MIGMRRVVILTVLGYRLIPAPVRRAWSASPSSGKALAALRDGAPVGATLRQFAVPKFTRIWEPPSWDN